MPTKCVDPVELAIITEATKLFPCDSIPFLSLVLDKSPPKFGMVLAYLPHKT